MYDNNMVVLVIDLAIIMKQEDAYQHETTVEQFWCGIYGMAPTIPAKHVVAITIPTIAVLFFTYWWYKKRSSRRKRNRADPGGGTTSSSKSKKQTPRLRNSMSSSMVMSVAGQTNPENDYLKNAMEKYVRDQETASLIKEVPSDVDSENESVGESPSSDISNHENKNDIENLQKVEEDQVVASETHVDDCAETAISIPDTPVVDNTEEEMDWATESANVSVQEECKLVNSLNVTADLEDARLRLDHLKLEETPQTNTTPLSTSDKQTNGKKYKNHLSTRTPVKSIQLASVIENNANDTNCKDKLDNALFFDNEEIEHEIINKLPEEQSPKRISVSTDIALDSDISKIDGHSQNQNCNTNTTNVSNSTQMTSQLSRSQKKRLKNKMKKLGAAVEHKRDETTVSAGIKVPCKEKDESIKVEYSSTKTAYNSCDSINIRTAIKYNNNNNNNNNINHQDGNCNKKPNHNHRTSTLNKTTNGNCDYNGISCRSDGSSAHYLDEHNSEVGSDSGKGNSERGSSPQLRSPTGGSVADDHTIYEFIIPVDHAGKLIGKKGNFINRIKDETGVRVVIKKHDTSLTKKICLLDGTHNEITHALEIIRARFPLDEYPDITLENYTCVTPLVFPLHTDLMPLYLVAGVNNDVVISSIVNAGHLFLQQPLHPTYKMLCVNNEKMNQVYSAGNAPTVSTPLKDNIVAAPAMGGWYRAQITSVDESTGMCEVKFLDYGGYLKLNKSSLKAIRYDFLHIPFQAVECFLANVTPKGGEWSEAAKLVVQQLTYGHMLHAQIVEYTADRYPLVALFVIHQSHVISINDELVVRGFAEYEDYYPSNPT